MIRGLGKTPHEQLLEDTDALTRRRFSQEASDIDNSFAKCPKRRSALIEMLDEIAVLAEHPRASDALFLLHQRMADTLINASIHARLLDPLFYKIAQASNDPARQLSLMRQLCEYALLFESEEMPYEVAFARVSTGIVLDDSQAKRVS